MTSTPNGNEAESRAAQLDSEIELLIASILPSESLTSSPEGAWPRQLLITSSDSRFSLHIAVGEEYPDKAAVNVQIKADDLGRDEAEGWKEWVEGIMREWDDQSETPLYTILTDYFLPLLAPSVEDIAPPETLTSVPASASLSVPHHVLIVTHHLISPTKRKNLIQLSSQLNLVGFSKCGHPGIVYASGDKEDLVEWLAEVKSWNWLALRVRVAIEPILGAPTQAEWREGGGGGKSRGDWVELEKLGEAMDWLSKRGMERMLVDAGVGSHRS